jgi:hypothetical protein
MKFIIVLLSISLFFAKVTAGQTQSELNLQSSEANKKAKIKLDSIYFSILKLYAKDSIFIKSIKGSQYFWTKYYKEQIKAMFPEYPDSSFNYGSMKSMCVTSYARSLVELRIKELEKWLVGSEQGDCSSSIKPKTYLPDYKKYIPFDLN